MFFHVLSRFTSEQIRTEADKFASILRSLWRVAECDNDIIMVYARDGRAVRAGLYCNKCLRQLHSKIQLRIDMGDLRHLC